MLRRSSLLAAIAIASACASTASAQHANFVLFGQPTEGVKDMDPSNRFVHPITAPYFAEDSFITSDVRAIFMYHSYASSFGFDNSKLYAVQARLALTNQFQAVLYKAGYHDFSSGGDDGNTDFGLGVKWNFLQDWGNNLHAAAGIGYEAAGGGAFFEDDDEIRAWISVDKGFGKLHVGGSLNFRYGNDDTRFFIDDNGTPVTNDDQVFPDVSTTDASILSLHLHADYYVNKWVSPVVELNYYQPISAGDGKESLPNGGDLFNFATDQSSLTMGLGVELRPIDNLGIRAAYEFAVFSDDDTFGTRLTVSALYGF